MPLTVRLDRSSSRMALWASWLVAALLLLEVFSGAAYLLAITASGLLITRIPGSVPHPPQVVDRAELWVIAGLYAAVVALLAAAFLVFGTANTLGLFLCFASALLIGVVGPLIYTVWVRRGSIGDLGLTMGTCGEPPSPSA